MIETSEHDWRFGKIEIPVNDVFFRKSIELTGEYSGTETDMYQALLGPGDVALDIGANIGVFAIAMGLSVGPPGRVIAFEPQPPIAAILGRNVERHDLAGVVEVRREIVSDTVGSGQFVDVRSLPAGEPINFGALSRETKISRAFGAMAETPVVTIDSLELESCALIKIDVEGAESAAIHGARETIARCRPILSVECDRTDADYTWIDELLAAGYRLWRFRGTYLRTPNPKGANLEGEPRIVVLMLLAVPPERLGLLKRIDGKPFQPVDSRETLQRLSQNVGVYKPPGAA